QVEKATSTIKEHLATSGYVRARVRPLGERLAYDRMKLIFSVDIGPQITISEFRFTGISNFANDELVNTMKTCLGSRWHVYDARHIDFCAQTDVRKLMHSRGYIEAKISPSSTRFISDKAEITFGVTEGLRYRWGEMKVVGSKLFNESEI